MARPTALTPTRPGITGLQLLDLETYLPGDLLLKADLASMAHSLELRSPFLDHEVVALGLALPDSLKVRGREGKVALRRAFADLLPAEVDDARQDGLRRAARPLVPRRSARARTRPAPERPRLVPARGRSSACSTSTRSGRADHGHRLWCLLMLELWQREHVEAPVLVPAA